MFEENNQSLRFLTGDGTGKLMAACSDRLKPIVEVAIRTGIRRGELFSLKWGLVWNGFADFTMTLRYAHLSQAHLQSAVAVLNGLGNGHSLDYKMQNRDLPLISKSGYVSK
jgi:hypothetical protein